MPRESQHDQSDGILVRPMSVDERAIWEELWTGYLDFYETKISQETKSITWARLHDPNEPMYLLAASLAGKIVGIVHYLYHRSCWTIGDYCYLQDLFVAVDARGKGVGTELIKCSLATFTSRTILPVSSTMQTLVSLTDTSNPAKWSMLRFSF